MFDPNVLLDDQTLSYFTRTFEESANGDNHEFSWSTLHCLCPLLGQYTRVMYPIKGSKHTKTVSDAYFVLLDIKNQVIMIEGDHGQYFNMHNL